MKFKKGRSGNPNGRPKGITDKRVQLRELLLPRAADLVEKAVKLALKGDVAALRLCLDRLIPPLKARDSTVNSLTEMRGSLKVQGETVLQALTNGQVTPEEAATLMQILVAQSRVVESSELEQRLKRLEETINAKYQVTYPSPLLSQPAEPH